MTPDTAPPVPPAGVVRLRVPADSRYARVVRVTVGAFAVRLGLHPEVVEDLRLAIDEALILLLATLGADEDTTHVDLVLGLDQDPTSRLVTLELETDPAPVRVAAGSDAIARFHELIPTAVAIEAVDLTTGRVVLCLGDAPDGVGG